jgi:hypothetical protein
MDHMSPQDKPPQYSAVVTCSCCWQSFRYAGTQITRGMPKQNPECVSKKPISGNGAKTEGAVLIAASIVAAIRLRGDEVKPSPKLTAIVRDSVLLAKTVLAQLER